MVVLARTLFHHAIPHIRGYRNQNQYIVCESFFRTCFHIYQRTLAHSTLRASLRDLPIDFEIDETVDFSPRCLQLKERNPNKYEHLKESSANLEIEAVIGFSLSTATVVYHQKIRGRDRTL